MEMFPQMRKVTKDMLNNLVDMVTFAYHGDVIQSLSWLDVHSFSQADAKTSSTSTAPYTPEKLKEIIEMLKEVRGTQN